MLQNAGLETCVGEYTKMGIAPNMRVRKLNTLQRLFLQNAADERLIFCRQRLQSCTQKTTRLSFQMDSSKPSLH